jgi:hypothetical protein
MKRRLVIALSCIAVAAGGCAVTTALPGLSSSPNGSASSSTSAAAPSPGNVYGPEVNHYFGTGGP